MTTATTTSPTAGPATGPSAGPTAAPTAGPSTGAGPTAGAGATPNWRERKRERTRSTLRHHAMRLFLEKGFDATTVEEIASAAGVSHMTFFRYFPTKEDAALADVHSPAVADLVAGRPADEPAAERIQRALVQGVTEMYSDDPAGLLTRMQLVMRTPALRAGNWERQTADQQVLVDALSGQAAQDELGARVLVAASLATVTEAVRFWAERDGVEDLPTVVDRAFAALRDQRHRFV